MTVRKVYETHVVCAFYILILGTYMSFLIFCDFSDIFKVNETFSCDICPSCLLMSFLM